ncbi:3'(2'),5'-bisphosphate nucleotidase CysQ [Neptunomonas japonica]|uniref:3'(2'),5'-bisphosphate nucleotidase CysQ n=1 Tax=Neptunomonas japonica TaxID=417574 RepID=UPI0004067FD8|nr:3'(2'),5'-bisphosphate nucleotidase CysQ [Neptunomonas japonica]
MLNELKIIIRQAGYVVLDIYHSGYEVSNKADLSPVTDADIAAHNILLKGLRALTPDIPILSEESYDAENTERLNWPTFWLVDPLDGTKEFIKRNGEFTINIALIVEGVPVLGLVYAPVTNTLYWGQEGKGAYKQISGALPITIHVAPVPKNAAGWRVVGSRSHQSDRFYAFMQALPDADIVAIGSSLKLCLVAEGSADLYPRLSPTSEWDTAAGHAVLLAAGGQLVEWPSLKPLLYNVHVDTILNPDFMACAKPSSLWASIGNDE